MAQQDFFDFWKQVPAKSSKHPADESVLDRLETKFNFNCLPGPFLGPLRTAKIVLLFLSPGFDAIDLKHFKSEEGRQYYAEQRTGYKSLPTAEQHPSAYKWLSSRLNQFGLKYDNVRERVAILNIAAYKSEDFHDWPALVSLPSSRRCVDWAQTVLFPLAEKQEKVVVCLRSHNYWGLGVGKPKGFLFRPKCTIGGFTYKGADRDQITASIRKILGSG